VRGILPPGKLYENVLQNGGRSLQHIVVPVPLNPKSLSYQAGIPCCITRRLSMLTAVYFNNDALLEAHEVENVVLKGDLSSELVLCKASIAEQSPHRQFRVGGFVPHLLREAADAFGDGPMAWWLRPEPLTRRLTS